MLSDLTKPRLQHTRWFVGHSEAQLILTEQQADAQQPPKPDVNSLPPETIEFAHRMFNAAREGNDELLLAAIDAGLPVNLTNDKGSLLIHVAPRNYIQTAFIHRKHISYASSLWCIPIHIREFCSIELKRCLAGHASLTESLLTRGADPNRLNDMGQSVLAGAVFKGYDDVVRALVASRFSNADPRLGKPTAIEAAHMFGRTHLMEILGAREGDVGPEVPGPVGSGGL